MFGNGPKRLAGKKFFAWLTAVDETAIVMLLSGYIAYHQSETMYELTFWFALGGLAYDILRGVVLGRKPMKIFESAWPEGTLVLVLLTVRDAELTLLIGLVTVVFVYLIHQINEENLVDWDEVFDFLKWSIKTVAIIVVALAIVAGLAWVIYHFWPITGWIMLGLAATALITWVIWRQGTIMKQLKENGQQDVTVDLETLAQALKEDPSAREQLLQLLAPGVDATVVDPATQQRRNT